MYMQHNYDQVPQELKDLNRWVNWKQENRNGKPTKTPYQSKLGANPPKADPTDPKTWSNYSSAYSCGYSTSGIGFVLGDNWGGIDIDGIYDKDDQDKPIPAILQPFVGKAYIEYSPSGTGIKAFFVYNGFSAPNKPDNQWGSRKDDIEIYLSNRYFTVTGEAVSIPSGSFHEHAEHNTRIAEQILRKLKPEWWNKEDKKTNKRQKPSSLSAIEIIDLIRKSDQGSKFSDLFDYGDLSACGNNASRGDMALAGMLVFWCNKDSAIMTEIFKGSALYENINRKSNPEEYLRRTISRAIALHGSDDCFGDTRQDQQPKQKERPNIEDHTEDEISTEIFDQKENFMPYRFVNYLTDELGMKFISLGLEPGILRILNNGVYKKDHCKELVKIAHEVIGERRREPMWYKKVYELLIDEQRAYEQEGHFPGLHEDYINCRNGFIEISTGMFFSHEEFYKKNPNVVSLIQIPVDYNPNAVCQEFEGFLLEKQEDSQEDVDLIYQAVFGASLLQYIPIPMFVEFQGETNTGKSTVFKVLGTFLGRDNYSAESIHNIDNVENRFCRGELYGKLANIDADTSERCLKGDGYIKKLSAGDPIQIERKNAHPRMEVPFATMLYSANYDVKTADLSSGWESRLIRIPFNVQHLDKAIVGYENRFTTDEELSGILNKALAGIQRLLREHKYIRTKRTEDAKASFIISNNPVMDWIENNCLLDQEMLHQGELKPARYAIEKFYNVFIAQTSLKCDRREFYRYLKKWANVDKFKNNPRYDNTGRGNFVEGLALISTDYDGDDEIW